LTRNYIFSFEIKPLKNPRLQTNTTKSTQVTQISDQRAQTEKMALGLRAISGEPVIDTENGEELKRVLPGVDIALANLPRESPGTLYITTK